MSAPHDNVFKHVEYENIGRKCTLNGRPAVEFIWLISEKQFQVYFYGPDGSHVFAESSSMSTFCKAMGQMMKLAGHPDAEFALVEKPAPEQRLGGHADAKFAIASEKSAHIVVCPHGKTLVMLVDAPLAVTEVAQQHGWIKNGLTVERVTEEEAKRRPYSCAACQHILGFTWMKSQVGGER